MNHSAYFKYILLDKIKSSIKFSYLNSHLLVIIFFLLGTVISCQCGNRSKSPSKDIKNPEIIDSMISTARSRNKYQLADVLLKLQRGEAINLASYSNVVLREAVELADLSILDLLIKKGVDVNAKDNEGNTFLHYAALLGKSAIIDKLLEKGADINAKNNEGNTPLHIAASFLGSKLAKKLLKAGADKSITNKSGQTPLDIASTEEIKDLLS